MTRYSSTMSEALLLIREGAFKELQIVAKDLAKYAAQDKKGMDYKDFMKAAAMMKSGKIKELGKFTMDLDTEPREKIILMVKDAIGKKAAERVFNVTIREEDEPASPDEGSMALDQLKFMRYAADKMMQHIQGGGEFPEWMQNKLSGTHEKFKSLYANIEHGEMKESVELEEAFVQVSSKHLLDLSMGYRTYLRALSNKNNAKIKYAKEKIRNAEAALGIRLPTFESVELQEKLKVSDGLGAWIDDFKKSDAPQFQGKSDEEKKNMAIAAFTDAGGKLDEGTVYIYREYEPGQYFEGDLKKLQMDIKKAGGKILDVEKPTRREPNLSIEVDGDYKKIKRQIEKDDDGLTAIEEQTLSELAMPRKDFEKLKKGDKVTITYDSSIRRGTTTTFTVTGRSKSAKYDVEKVSMTADGKGKYYLYSRKGGDATLALGDMGASMTKIVKEEIDPIIAEGMVDTLAKEFEKRVKKQGYSSRTQDRERMAVLGMAKKKGATPADMKKLDAAIVSIINKLNEEEEPKKPEQSDGAKAVAQARDDKKKTRIAQLQLQIAKAQETINKLNAQEKPSE